jgi:hypothetical protein
MTMAFVNEYIPEADLEKYGIEEIDGKFLATGTKSRTWTVDRDRNIYLRCVAQGRDELSRISTWTFYWKGELLWFKREGIGVEKKSDGLRHAHSRITDFTLPERLEPHRQEIYQDLRDAFHTYGGGGVFSTSTDYVHDLEFAEQGRDAI